MENICRRNYHLLRIVYGLVPIVAGADKFFNLLTDWSDYLAPQFASMIPVSPGMFMGVVGFIEIAAGLLVLSSLVRVGGYVVSAWLVSIAFNLILLGQYDVAVRDLVMAVGAFALGQLATVFGPHAAAEHETAGQARLRTTS
jgi:uncharacterized membrane protein YphA (DoxX/SURF4 family)